MVGTADSGDRATRASGEAETVGARATEAESAESRAVERVSRSEPASPEPPPIDDPYLVALVDTSFEKPKARQTSKLALASLASLLAGPIGPICAIVFGWAARREIDRAPDKRGYGLATVAMIAGAVLTAGWGAGLGLYMLRVDGVVSGRQRTVDSPAAALDDKNGGQGEVVGPYAVGAAPPAQGSSSAPHEAEGPTVGSWVPKDTRISRIGGITVVDIGVSAPSLREELAHQRALGTRADETLVVMVTRDACKPCRGVDKALADPLMQAALTRTRLIRIDSDVFKEDLEGLSMNASGVPAFFLLAVDLTPRDAIDGGEWDDDVAANIAPVLGAFVRGKYDGRRRAWQAPPGTGLRL